MQRVWKASKCLLALALLVASCVIVVILFNTLRFSSKQIQVPELELLKLDEEPMIERLRGAIRHETVTYQNPARIDQAKFESFHAYLRGAFPKVHEKLERFTGEQLSDERNLSLLFKWTGRKPELEAILFMAHCDVAEIDPDTVPIDPDTVGRWTHEPFAGDFDDQYIWGRGTLDVKDGVLGLLEAVEHLLSEDFVPQQTIYLSLGHDEEVGGTHGNQEIAAWMRRQGIKLKFVLDEGGCIFDGVPGVDKPVALVGVAEKGYVTLLLVAKFAAGGHASMPPQKTAIGVLVKALARLEDQPFPRRIDGGVGLMLDYIGPEMPFLRKLVLANRWLFSGLIEQQFGAADSGNAVLRTTLVTTMIDGGFKENVIPTQAKARVDVRILPGDGVDRVLEYVRETVGDERVSIEIATQGRDASRISSTDSDSFRAIHTTVAEVFPGVIVSPFVLVGATDASHFEDISRNIYRFLPARLSEADLKRIHGIDERISRANYLEIVRFYVRLIQNCTF